MNGSLSMIASSAWVAYPSTCTWTATGPGGSTSITEVRTTEVENSAAEVITYFHNDAAGTPQLATDAKGNVLWQDQRLPFGSPLHNQNTSSLGYTGKPYDQDTGLLYLGARYYDPLLGRFLSMDPVEFDEGNLHSFNRYAYANNNPYRYVDPSGKIAETVWDAANLTWGITSFARNVAIQNYGGAMLDAAGIVYDGIATAVPGLPGGAGAALKAGRGLSAAKNTREMAKRQVSELRTAAELKKIYAWGNGELGVKAAREALDASAMVRIQGSVTREEVEATRNLYREAVAAGRGGAVAPERAAYMEDILKLWK